MKKKSVISLIAVSAMALSSVPFSAAAEGEVIYGTMNIPYNDFYSAEFGESANAYEVDAFSSATTSKWSKNDEGGLFEGTYNQANEDGTGTILGVTYPVAITQAELDALGDNNYNFTAVDYQPTAYKTVTVTDGVASFSAVQDSEPATASDSAIKLSTSTPWGDYLIDVENSPVTGAIYGALIKTTDGNTYAMRHEENIWRGELAWSSGIKTSEPHGNTLSYENFVSLMGSTISEVTFITLDGYVTVPTETYVPVKFAGEVAVENSVSGTGSTAMSLTGFPDDFAKVYEVSGEGFSATDTEISYTEAQPGSYTITVSDGNGKYAEVSGSFVLSTDSMPATYSDGKLVKADGASDDDFANFVKNISVVTVNGKDYTASGRGATTIIGEDGTIDFNASSRNENVFDGSGNYTMVVSATGYNNSLGIEIKAEAPATTEAPASSTTAKPTAGAGNSTTTAKPSSTTTTAKSTASSTDSPKTGVAGMALPLTAMALAGVSAFVFRKKND
ncbi:MAG: DUF1533 domain-containing protein [Ruminococcus flavefaciens]|nr:DUF1533 domain-containing protein [Ruminococcus flavefaciens]MCM1230834.1 DUF1533 domain-containing protein [Ruminococcus flavefaciens]